jgi:hypothetical protein
MNKFEESTIYQDVKKFKFPRYSEITDIGLYLDQVIKVLETILSPILGDNEKEKWISIAMISNYYKLGIISKPENKRYGRDHIVYLVFICISKMVLPLSNIKEFISIQQEAFTLPVAYDYFCTEFENILNEVFGEGKSFVDSGKTNSTEAKIVRSFAFAVAHKIYLGRYLEFIELKATIGPLDQ